MKKYTIPNECTSSIIQQTSEGPLIDTVLQSIPMSIKILHCKHRPLHTREEASYYLLVVLKWENYLGVKYLLFVYQRPKCSLTQNKTKQNKKQKQKSPQ